MEAKNPLEVETRALLFLLQHLTNITIDRDRINIHTDSINLWTNFNKYLAGNSVSIQYARPMDLKNISLIQLAHINHAHNIGADFLAKQGARRPNIIWGY